MTDFRQKCWKLDVAMVLRCRNDVVKSQVKKSTNN
nr:MAG TPA: hypothetical protein [Caudoviricetes sp.]